ncbi:MAG: hypothetical protein Kow0042_29570 [Calditrichia bacterium]
MLFVAAQQLIAITLEIELQSDQSAFIYLWLDSPATTQQKQLIGNLSQILNRNYPGNIRAELLSDYDTTPGDGMRIQVKDFSFLHDPLNCIDFRFDRSFFKHKYYLKILLNPQIFQSKIFSLMADEGMEIGSFQCLLLPHGQLEIWLQFPGECVETNMKLREKEYYYIITYEAFQKYGGNLLYRSARFIPRVYLTVFFLIIILLAIATRIWRKGGYRQKKASRDQPPEINGAAK